jgi:uncharacterized protein
LELLPFIKSKISISERSILNTISLLKEDATIPFIARYRKELTGNLDEVEIEKISDLLNSFTELEKRKKSIINCVSHSNADPKLLSK